MPESYGTCMEFLWKLYGIRMVHQAPLARAAGYQHWGSARAIRVFGRPLSIIVQSPLMRFVTPISRS